MHVGGDFVRQYIQENIRILLVGVVVFAVGTAAGSLYCVSLPPDADAILGSAFAGADGLLKITDSLHIFISAFLNYFRVWFFLWLCGTCAIGIPLAPILLGVRGFVCGFSVSVLILLYRYKGLAAAAAGILPQMLILLPTLLLLCVAAVRQAKNAVYLTDRSVRRSRFFSYCMLCVLYLTVFLLAALYEGYVGWLLIVKILA